MNIEIFIQNAVYDRLKGILPLLSATVLYNTKRFRPTALGYNGHIQYDTINLRRGKKDDHISRGIQKLLHSMLNLSHMILTLDTVR